jgi:hypothetical protein
MRKFYLAHFVNFSRKLARRRRGFFLRILQIFLRRVFAYLDKTGIVFQRDFIFVPPLFKGIICQDTLRRLL